jgi:hypothetical protein
MGEDCEFCKSAYAQGVADGARRRESEVTKLRGILKDLLSCDYGPSGPMSESVDPSAVRHFRAHLATIAEDLGTLDASPMASERALLEEAAAAIEEHKDERAAVGFDMRPGDAALVQAGVLQGLQMSANRVRGFAERVAGRAPAKAASEEEAAGVRIIDRGEDSMLEVSCEGAHVHIAALYRSSARGGEWMVDPDAGIALAVDKVSELVGALRKVTEWRTSTK